MHLECEPVLGYGTQQVTWEYTGTGYNAAKATSDGSDVEMRPHHRPQPRLRGVARPRPPDDARRRHRLLRADVEQRAGAPGLRRGLQARRAHRGLLARVARARRLPRPPVAAVPAAVRADAEGAVVRAHRRDGRRGHDLPAGDAARRAQLGLPLLVDPRLHVHALGPLHARLRLGGQRLLLLHRRCRRQRARPPDHVRDRWRAPAGGIGARPPRRLRGREAGPGRQRRLRAPPARRLGDDPRLVLPAHEVARRPARPLLADPVQAGGDGDHALARAGPRHLGGARRAQALHVLQGHVLGGLRPRRAPGADARRARPGRALAGGGGRDPRRRPRARHRRARRLRAALRDHGARRLAPAAAPRAVPAARGRARPRHRDGHRRRADRRRPRAALQGRGDRRRPRRRGGDVRDLLLLARERARRDRRVVAGPRAVRADAELREPAAALRGGDRPAIRAPPGELPAGVHAPRAHQRRDARHPRRLRARDEPGAAHGAADPGTAAEEAM